MSDNLRHARREAQAGLARAESLREEAQRAGSSLQPHIDYYEALEAAWRLVAASHEERIEREGRGS